VDLENIPDLAPPLAVLAASRDGITEFVNGERLRFKESDRIKSIVAMINDLGGHAEEMEDGFVITGTGSLVGGDVDSYGDHRIVMAAAIASGICSEPVYIEGAEAVCKSYPDFFEQFRKLGGKADVC